MRNLSDHREKGATPGRPCLRSEMCISTDAATAVVAIAICVELWARQMGNRPKTLLRATTQLTHSPGSQAPGRSDPMAFISAVMVGRRSCSGGGEDGGKPPRLLQRSLSDLVSMCR